MLKDEQRTDVEGDAWTQDAQPLSFLYPAASTEHLLGSLERQSFSHMHSESYSAIKHCGPKMMRWDVILNAECNGNQLQERCW